ncbi:hypothetical protein APHAL10511_004920 [Amanita phalloides]|nr:hypothetical protein APHAL10511_004920 [Amanita phalloides]
MTVTVTLKLRGMDTKKVSKSSDHESSSEASDSVPLTRNRRDTKPTSSKSPAKVRKRDRDDDDHPSSTVKKPRIDKDVMSEVHRTSSGEGFIDIGKKKRITVSVFNGVPLVGIREYYGPDGEEKPSKKGISLTVEQWTAVKSNVAAVDQLLSEITS